MGRADVLRHAAGKFHKKNVKEHASQSTFDMFLQKSDQIGHADKVGIFDLRLRSTGACDRFSMLCSPFSAFIISDSWLLPSSYLNGICACIRTQISSAVFSRPHHLESFSVRCSSICSLDFSSECYVVYRYAQYAVILWLDYASWMSDVELAHSTQHRIQSHGTSPKGHEVRFWWLCNHQSIRMQPNEIDTCSGSHGGLSQVSPKEMERGIHKWFDIWLNTIITFTVKN